MFKTIMTYQHTEGKIMNPVSETIPDQSMPIRTILSRFVRGESIKGAAGEALYFGEEYVPEPRKLDLVDLQEMREQNAEAYASLQRKHKAPAKQAEGAVVEATTVDENVQVEPAEH